MLAGAGSDWSAFAIENSWYAAGGLLVKIPRLLEVLLLFWLVYQKHGIKRQIAKAEAEERSVGATHNSRFRIKEHGNDIATTFAGVQNGPYTYAMHEQ